MNATNALTPADRPATEEETAEFSRAFHPQPGLTLEQFRRAHPVVRGFTHYTSEQRANHASSTKLTAGERRALGLAFYWHPLRPDCGYPTAAAALAAAFETYQRGWSVPTDRSPGPAPCKPGPSARPARRS